MNAIEVLERARDKALKEVSDLHREQLEIAAQLDQITDELAEKRVLVVSVTEALRRLNVEVTA